MSASNDKFNSVFCITEVELSAEDYVTTMSRTSKSMGNRNDETGVLNVFDSNRDKTKICDRDWWRNTQFTEDIV